MTEYKGHSHGEYDDECPICYLDRELSDAKKRIKELEAEVEEAPCKFNCRKVKKEKDAFMAGFTYGEAETWDSGKIICAKFWDEVTERDYKEWCK